MTHRKAEAEASDGNNEVIFDEYWKAIGSNVHNAVWPQGPEAGVTGKMWPAQHTTVSVLLHTHCTIRSRAFSMCSIWCWSCGSCFFGYLTQ